MLKKKSKEQEKYDELMKMKLHETIEIDRLLSVTRVPTGWLYRVSPICYDNITTTFVPETLPGK